MSQRVLWTTIGAVAVAHLAVALIAWEVLSWSGGRPEPGPAATRGHASGPLPPSIAVQRLAETLSNAAFRSVIMANNAALNELIRLTSAWPEVIYVSVEDGQGRIIAHSDPSLVGQTWIPPSVREPYQEAIAPVPGSDASGTPGPIVGRVRLGFAADPSVAPTAPAPRPSRGGARLAVALALAAAAAVPVGFGLLELGARVGSRREAIVTDLRGIRTVRQARGAIVHWMRETDFVRAQLAGQREELQRLKAEVTQGARHLAQTAAESEQLLTERAHWMGEREHLSAELTERDRELDRLRVRLDERASEAEGTRQLLDAEIGDLREEVRQAHAALASHPTVCREFLERELRQHQHRAVAYISHAIRGSLTSVLGFSKLLLREGDGPLTESQRANVRHVHEAGVHLLRVVNDLSDLTQVESGMVELRDEVVDVGTVMRELASTGAAALGREPEHVTVAAPQGLPPVRGNARRLTQLLLTLMHAPTRRAEGPVDVSASADEASVAVVVTHHGVSIPAQDLGSLDPFGPIDASSTLQDDGRRLRLALARALATMIGGSVEIDGQASAGTAFTVRLPIAADMSAVA